MPFDVAVFRIVNGLAGKNPFLDALGVAAASGLVFILGVLVIVPFLLRRKNGLVFAVKSFLAAAVGWAASEFIGFVFFLTRPFVVLAGVDKLIDRGEWEPSFPSGHATIVFAFAVSLFLYAREMRNASFRALSYIGLALAAGVALSRVFVGVHYPLDVLGGAFLGTLAAATVFVIGRAVTPNKHETRSM